jgi:outer membrane protein TolC
MRRSWILIASLLMVVWVVPGTGQVPDSTIPKPLATLSVEEALTQARANSPEYRQVLNNAGPAEWAVKNAWGSLLPRADLSGGMAYTGAGRVNFGQGLTQRTSAVIGSSWGAGLLLQLDGSRILGPGEQKANQHATDQEIENEGVTLRYNITNQYMLAAAGAALVSVSRQQVERNASFLELAQARYQVGQGTLIEVRQAEVQKSAAEVQLLRDQQAENEAKLELFRQMGITPPVSVEQIALTDSFPVTEPTLKLEDLLSMAAEENPALKALRYRADAASSGVKSAKSAFLPSLAVQAGWGGFTQQQTDENLLVNQATAGASAFASNCIFEDSIRTAVGFGGVVGTPGCYQAAGLDPTGTTLTSSARTRLLNVNNTFPFDFTKSPFGMNLTISLPIFTGFGRSLRLSQARELEQDADENLRATGLLIQSEVNARYLGLQTAYKAISAQAASREAARDQLRLAQDRYRLGSGSSLEVTDAQNAVQKAEGDYIAAVYAYHRAFAILEAAVGRPLR